MTAVSYVWCGAVTPTTAEPVFVLDGPATVRAVVSADADFTAPVYSSPVVADANNTARCPVAGLSPGVRYYYAAEIGGTLDTVKVGRVWTAPVAGPLRLTFGSCWAGPGQGGATADYNHPVGAAVAAADPHLHIFDGDFGYPNNNTASATPYRTNYALMHSVPNVATMARSVGWILGYSDHDSGPDNANSTHVGVPFAASVYGQMAPHYTLPDTTATYQSVVLSEIGVRIIVTDHRRYRSPDANTDNSSKTQLGATQKQWLKDQWLAARNADQLIVWVTEQIWCIDGAFTTSGINADGDHWGAFSTERAELDNYRSVNGIRDMVILSGDGHQISYRNAVDYSTTQDVPVPCYSAAAYSRTAAFRPADWDQTSASSDADGHYGLLTISPQFGGGWAVDCEFHEVHPTTGDDSVAFAAPRQRFSVVDPGLYTVGGLAVNVGGVPHYVQL